MRDRGAVLIAEALCTAVDAHTARCSVTEGTPGVRGFAVDLGDCDDTLAIDGDMRVETTLAGGGRDRVRCGVGRDWVVTDATDVRRSCERRPGARHGRCTAITSERRGRGLGRRRLSAGGPAEEAATPRLRGRSSP